MKVSRITVALCVALVAAGCVGEGSNAEDQRRLDRLLEDPIVETRIDGLEERQALSTVLAETDDPLFSSGAAVSAVRLTFRFSEEPTAAALRNAARAYADALIDAGWPAVDARCQKQTEGPTLIKLTSGRNEHGYLESVLVEFQAGQPLWTITVRLAAPHHSRSGGSPSGDADLSCIDNAGVE